MDKVLTNRVVGIAHSIQNRIKGLCSGVSVWGVRKLPSDFFNTVNDNASPSEFVVQLRKHFSRVQPTPASRHGKAKVFVFKEPASCTHVFVRTDAIKAAMQTPYEGPYQVLIFIAGINISHKIKKQ